MLCVATTHFNIPTQRVSSQSHSYRFSAKVPPWGWGFPISAFLGLYFGRSKYLVTADSEPFQKATRQTTLNGGHVGLAALSSMKPLALLSDTPSAVSGCLRVDAGSRAPLFPLSQEGRDSSHLMLSEVRGSLAS